MANQNFRHHYFCFVDYCNIIFWSSDRKNCKNDDLRRFIGRVPFLLLVSVQNGIHLFLFSNNNKNLVFRFYSLRNLYGKPKTIEIFKSEFCKYDIVSGFFNGKESLVLYRKTPKGIAKYPPISLTLLTKKQKTDLKRVLYAASAHQ